MAGSSVIASGSTRGGRRRFSGSLAIVAGLVILYLASHSVWPAGEPGRVLWAGPVGAALEWVWWAAIGAAVRALTMAARSLYGPAETPRSRGARWPGFLVVVFTALLVWGLLVLRAVVRGDWTAMVLTVDFDTPPGTILVPVAFGLGFFHRLAVPCLQQVARSTWEALKCTTVSLPGWWRGFWEGIRAMWQDRRRLL